MSNPPHIAKRDAEQERAEMMRFWQSSAIKPGPPDPRPLLEKVSVLIVIHRLAQSLPTEQASKVQRATLDAFRDLATG